MRHLMQAACVAGAVIFSAAGCKHCCGDKSTSNCPDGQCPPGATPGMVTGPGTATVTPTTVGPNGYMRMPAGQPTGQRMPGY